MTADPGRVEGSDSGVSHNRRNCNPEIHAVNSAKRIHWREVRKGQGTGKALAQLQETVSEPRQWDAEWKKREKKSLEQRIEGCNVP